MAVRVYTHSNDVAVLAIELGESLSVRGEVSDAALYFADDVIRMNDGSMDLIFGERALLVVDGLSDDLRSGERLLFARSNRYFEGAGHTVRRFETRNDQESRDAAGIVRPRTLEVLGSYADLPHIVQMYGEEVLIPMGPSPQGGVNVCILTRKDYVSALFLIRSTGPLSRTGS